jgi:hypothetical protein
MFPVTLLAYETLCKIYGVKVASAFWHPVTAQRG